VRVSAIGDADGEMARGVLLSSRHAICVVAGCTLDDGACLPLGSQLSLVTHCAFNISACDLDGDEDGETVEIRRLLVDLLPLGAEHCLVKWLLTRCWCF